MTERQRKTKTHYTEGQKTMTKLVQRMTNDTLKTPSSIYQRGFGDDVLYTFITYTLYTFIVVFWLLEGIKSKKVLVFPSVKFN